MRSLRARRNVLSACVGALLIAAPTADANHATFTFNATPDTTNSYADTTSFSDFDSDEPETMEIQVPTGWLIAHQVASPATPISPVPDDEEVIGSGTATALWVHTLCDRNRDLALSVTWEATIDAGAPANTVAQVTITATNIFNTQAYIVRNAAEDYDIEIPDMPDASCTSTTDGLVTLLIDGETADGDKVARNPSTTGNKQATMIYTDRNAVTHTTNTTETIN